MKPKTYDIHERIFKFIVEVINLLNKLPKNPTNLIFINQCTRSATSIGANDQEADGALTKNDFIHGYTTALKENKETVFWLRIIGSTNPPLLDETNKLVKEGNEIVAIISTIIKNTSKNHKDRKY